MEGLAKERCVDLFAGYGVDLLEWSAPKAPDIPLLYCGVVGFCGRGVRGSLAVAGSRATLCASNPSPSSSVRDWAGELANQLIGQVKSYLLAYGVEIDFSTPVVLSGAHLAVRAQPSQAPCLFTCAGGSELVGVWIDVETRPGFFIAEQLDPNQIGLIGGDALLF